MRRSSNGCLYLSCAGLVLAAALAANGQYFNYSEDFNNVPAGTKPPGWSTLNKGDDVVGSPSVDPTLDPVVLDADTTGWANPVNYGVSWSGGKRLNLIHPGQNTKGRAAVAWYAGPATGYPMNLQASALRAEFDLSMRKGTSDAPADGGVFAIVPVTDLQADLQRIGGGGGGMAWAGLGGFAIEFDIWDNNDYYTGEGDGYSFTDPCVLDAQGRPISAHADTTNHIGLDVFLNLQDGRVVSLVTELDPPLNLEPGVMPRFIQTGDNNQPLHFTVYYNDPNEGGAGKVRVYVKVDPNTKASGETGTPISFGMDTGHPDGALVLEACVGAWPTAEAIFGFTGSTGGANCVYQVDNIKVKTAAIASGDPCPLTNLPAFDPSNPDTGDTRNPADNVPVVLTATKVADTATAALSQPGWDIQTYAALAGNLDGCKASIAYAEAHGLRVASVTGVPDINYDDNGGDGCGGNLPGYREFPGFPGRDHDDMDMLAKGWIAFPADNPNDPNDDYPRHYYLSVNSDDGFEVTIGGQYIASYRWGRGCGSGLNAGTYFDLQVPVAGVYPIQIVWFEGGGGAGIEFYRRFPTDSLLLIPSMQAVGANTGPYADQPKIYGLLNGKAASMDIASFVPVTLPTVDLSPTEKVAGTGTGEQVFTFKTVRGPNNYPWNNSDIGRIRDGSGDTTALRFLDALDGVAGGATGSVVNFRSPGSGDGRIPNGSVFPGIPDGADQFAFRAEGFAYFATPGVYLLGMSQDDDGYIRFGKQTVYSSGCCPTRFFQLNVSEAGLYPIRAEVVEWGGGDNIDLFQPAAPGAAWVCVNDAGSNIKVFKSATSGAYVWPSNGFPISASRKVADVGQGDVAGWNATLAKESADMAALKPIDRTGLGTALTENDLVGVGTGFAAVGTDTPDSLNYFEVSPNNDGDQGRFGNNRLTEVFGSVLGTPGTNDNYAITATGYIEFKTAGDYAFGTIGDDGVTLWIAGQIVSVWPFAGGAEDNTPAIVRITEPGIYDIRVDGFENGWNYDLEFFQYLGDGTAVLVNDPKATVTVYRTLKSAPASTKFANPVRIPASAKVADINRGGTPGFHVQVANCTPADGNRDGGIGHDKFYTLAQATELLDAVFGVAPSLSQKGTAVTDTVVGQINFPNGDGDSAVNFPGPPNNDDFAVRVNGLLALKAGGHVFEIPSDDGFNFYIGDYNVGTCGDGKGNSNVQFYVYVSEDGLYPFKFDYREGCCGNSLVFNEIVFSLKDLSITTEVVNTGNASKAYVNVSPCHIPFADADADGDVDLVDFGLFQACFTGVPTTGQAPTIPASCSCFNRNNDAYIDAVDFGFFQNCFTGPSIKWTQAAFSNCEP